MIWSEERTKSDDNNYLMKSVKESLVRLENVLLAQYLQHRGFIIENLILDSLKYDSFITLYGTLANPMHIRIYIIEILEQLVLYPM